MPKEMPQQTCPPAGARTGPVTAAPAAGGAGPDRPASAPDSHAAPPTDATMTEASTAARVRVAELERQVSELEDRWRRAAAEADNLRKRYQRESAIQRDRERVAVAAAWVPVVDHLELALAHAKASPSAIIDGVRGIRDQALAVLAGLGFPRREDVGEMFDPARHEAVAATPTPHVPAGTVLEVLRPAYGEGERQLRPAAVVVAADPAGEHGGSGEHTADDRDAGGRSDPGAL